MTTTVQTCQPSAATAYGMKNSSITESWLNNTSTCITAPSTLSTPESSSIHTQFTLPTDGFRPTLHCRDISAEGKLLT